MINKSACALIKLKHAQIIKYSTAITDTNVIELHDHNPQFQEQFTVAGASPGFWWEGKSDKISNGVARISDRGEDI